MIRPRTFHGWEADGKFYVSLQPRDDKTRCGANVYETKAAAELECIIQRTDNQHGAPTIVWETP
jgi:hypothetical protein